MSKVTFKEEASAPATPGAGYVTFYAKTDGKLYFKDDTGTEYPVKPTGGGTGDLLSDGSVALTADWDVGSFKITAQQLESDVATGTAPLVVASTTAVTNLNADKVDGADLIDEDDMVSDSDTAVPTQQSVKAYVDSAVVGLFDDKGNYDASTNTPDLDTSPSGILKGDVYTVSVAGTFFTATVEVGDVLRALQDSPTALAHWAIVQTNLDAPSVKTLYESNSDTNALTDARAAAVDAALVDGDFSGSDGFMRKTGAGTYEVVKANMAATAAPNPATDDSSAGYAVGSTWWDTTNDEVYLCIDATTGAAIWKKIGDADAANVRQVIHTLHVETVENGDYVLTFDAPYAGVITLLRAKTESGTCTVTCYINGVALGGTACSAATTADEQAHASSNSYSKGDEVKVTVTSNSAATDLEVTFSGSRTDL